MSLTWSEAPNRYGVNLVLTAKSNDAIILTADVNIAQGNWPAIDGPKGTIHHVRIRSIWNSKEDLHSPRGTNPRDYRAQTPTKYGAKIITSPQDVKEYCEERWQEWKNKANVVEIQEAQ